MPDCVPHLSLASRAGMVSSLIITANYLMPDTDRDGGETWLADESCGHHCAACVQAAWPHPQAVNEDLQRCVTSVQQSLQLNTCREDKGRAGLRSLLPDTRCCRFWQSPQQSGVECVAVAGCCPLCCMAPV